MKLVKLNSFRHESGNCWIADLPEGILSGDCEDAPNASALRLFEDGRELGPGHCVHQLIRDVGNGAFSHWYSSLMLSTSDNRDPRSNGHEYVVLAPAANEDASLACASDTISAAASNVPSNYAHQEATPEKIEQDAKYSVEIARGYVEQLPGKRPYLIGKSVLELGPGWSFATGLVLKAWGAARVAVADRFLARFQPDYHLAVYREVIALLKSEDPNADVSALERCIELEGHPSDVIGTVEIPLEDLPNSVKQPFDIVLSNAVLEHVFDPRIAVASLLAVTADGGIGRHQVDFRDHRDFSKPLEYLLFDEFSFNRIFHEAHGECGNRIRPSQLRYLFQEVGFSDVGFQANMWAEDRYLDDLEPRLRAALASPYAYFDRALLTEISGRIWTRK